MGQRKLSVGFVAGNCCIRVIKEALVLRSMGHDVHLLAQKANQPNVFSSVSTYLSVEQFHNSIRMLDKYVDIFQVHNEPTWPLTAIREILPKAKLILDYHDSNYWRADKGAMVDKIHEPVHWSEEDAGVGVADGFVVPSGNCKAEVKTRTKKPIAVLPPAVPLSHYTYLAQNFAGGLVSQGGHVSPGEVHGDHWRDYTDLYSFLKNKKQVYVYSGDITYSQQNYTDKYYKDLGCKMGRFAYSDLLQELGKHTWNLVGNWQKEKTHWVWQYALPNKFFDAVAAGIPSVAFNTPEVCKIIKKYDIGICPKTPEELLDRWHEHKQKKVNLMLARKELTMEKFISALLKLYDKVL